MTGPGTTRTSGTATPAAPAAVDELGPRLYDPARTTKITGFPLEGT